MTTTKQHATSLAWQEAQSCRTLIQLHNALAPLRPPGGADPGRWREYHLGSAAAYEQIAKIDRVHYGESLYCAGRERREADAIANHLSRQLWTEYPSVVSTSSLREVRLNAFKSFNGQVLPVDAVTVLTGRNSAGKSNALDGIEVLSRLATGEELADALDGRRREGGPIRGGSQGCAPHGQAEFSLGCVVEADGSHFQLDVWIQVQPELRIVGERLQGPAPALATGRIETRNLIWTHESGHDAAGLAAEIHNGKRGTNPIMSFRDSRLLTSQLPLRITPKNDADDAVVHGAQAVTAALRGVFHLDPIPHFMRDYVPERDSDLRRTGANVSAAIAKLRREDEPNYKRIKRLVQQVGDERIRDIGITRSDLGDVMLALRETSSRRKSDLTPAREMSDGLLRFIAIATALLTSNRGLDIDPGIATGGPTSGVLLVIEELENGLHPSQAGRILDLIKEVSRELKTQVMVTTHSPALLNAMTGQLNRSVIVCYRDRNSGDSRLSRITDLPGYAHAMAHGRLGDVIAQGRLVRPDDEPSQDFSEFNRLIGIE